jgi:hypothetical protein
MPCRFSLFGAVSPRQLRHLGQGAARPQAESASLCHSLLEYVLYYATVVGIWDLEIMKSAAENIHHESPLPTAHGSTSTGTGTCAPIRRPTGGALKDALHPLDENYSVHLH